MACPFEVIILHTRRKRGTWLAPLVEDTTLDLGVVSLSPTLGVEILKNKILKKKKKKKKKKAGAVLMVTALRFAAL